MANKGYSSFHRKQPFDQANAEQVARSRRSDPQREEREKKTRAEGKELLQQRNELLKNYQKNDKVTDGKYIALVRRVDTLRGELIVGLVPTGKEMSWSPDFVNKIR